MRSGDPLMPYRMPGFGISMLKGFGLGILLYTPILLINSLWGIIETLVVKKPSTLTLLTSLVYVFPAALTWTLSTSVLIGVIIAVGRASPNINREYAIGLIKIILPFSLIIAIIVFILGSFVDPYTNFKWTKHIINSVYSEFNFEIVPSDFNESLPSGTILVNEITDEKIWKNVFYYQATQSGQAVLLGRRGIFSIFPGTQKASIQLYDVTAYSINGNYHGPNPGLPEANIPRSYANYVIEFSYKDLAHYGDEVKRAREKSLPELYIEVKRLEANIKTGAEEERNIIETARILRTDSVEINKKYALPVCTVVFGLLGLGIGYFFRRRDYKGNLLAGFGIIAVYWFLLIKGEYLAIKGHISPSTAMFGPVAFFALIATILIIALMYGKVKLSYFPRSLSRIRRFLTPDKKADGFFVRYYFKRYSALFILLIVALFVTSAFYYFLCKLGIVIGKGISIKLLWGYALYSGLLVVKPVLPYIACSAAILSVGLPYDHTACDPLQIHKRKVWSLSLIAFAILPCAFSFILQEKIAPRCYSSKDEIDSRIEERYVETHFSRHWFKNKRNNIFYYFNYADYKARRLYDLTAFVLDSETWTIKNVLYASAASFNGNLINLENGWTLDRLQAGHIPLLERYAGKAFSDDVNYNLIFNQIRDIRSMELSQLSQLINNIKGQGISPRLLEIAYYDRLSYLFSCLVMTLLGLSLIFLETKGGILISFFDIVALSMVYYGIRLFMIELGASSYLPPSFAGLGSNIVLGLYAVILITTCYYMDQNNQIKDV